MTYSNQQKINRFFAAAVVFSILFGNLIYTANARDIGQPDELNLGSSVFIFRGSSKKAQFDSTSPKYFRRSVASRKLSKTVEANKKAGGRKKSAKTNRLKTEKAISARTSIKQKNRNPRIAATNKKPPATTSNAVETLFNQAVENYNRENYSQAIDDYRQVIALDAMHPDAHANLASAYRQLEQFAEANSEYKLAAEYIKDDADLFSEWGYCLGKVDEWSKAIARLTAAKELTPDAIDLANVGWAYLNAARKESRLSNQTEARNDLVSGREILRQAVESNPQLAAALLNLGIVYNELGEYENAVEILKKANALRQDWLTAVSELGTAYLKSNDYSAAAIQFQKAIELDENFAPGYQNLGEAQYKLGRKKDAKKTLEKLRQINPELAPKLQKVLKGK